jgi:hypothetical protein
MRRHGATVVGGNLRELVFRTIYSAKNAEHQLAAAALGNVSPLTAGEAEMASGLNLAPGPVARAYEYWLRRLAEREGRNRSDAAVRAAELAARAPNPIQKQSEKRGEVEEKRKTKGEETMSFCRTLAVALFAFGSAPVAAQDTLKIAIGQINNWENQAPTLGEEIGIFASTISRSNPSARRAPARRSRRWCRARPISAPASASPA